MSNPFAEGAAYIRGQFVPVADAAIPVMDWGFTRSDCVYDVVHVVDGGFFRLDDHMARFAASMAARRLKPPESLAAMADILHRCVALSGLRDSFVAMVALRGKVGVPGSRKPSDCINHFVAYAVPWIDVIPQEVQARGAHLWVSDVPRRPDATFDPTVKNYQWGDFVTGLFEAEDNGFDTAVLCDAAGLVTEGPGFNIFVVHEGRVLTPDRGSLHGITRQTVLDLCEHLGIPAGIAPVPRALLEQDCDEVFLASTAGGVMPVSRVGRRILGNDRPGPVSLRLKDEYWRRHAQGWHRTPVRALEATTG